MPELPEVEAVVRALREDGIEGARILAVSVHRPSILKPQTAEYFCKVCPNRTITSVDRRAKNIVLHLSGGHALRVHLRMTGDLHITKHPQPDPSTRIQWNLSHKRTLRFTDARCLGRVHLHTEEELAETLQALGPEPLSRAFTAAKLGALAAQSRLPAKLFLLDQTKIAGLGNIYAAETLFRAGISPVIPANAIGSDAVTRLHQSIRDVLRRSIRSVYKAYRSPGGYRNHDNDRWLVYGREGQPCQACGNPIYRMSQGGRSTYYCGHCQG